MPLHTRRTLSAVGPPSDRRRSVALQLLLLTLPAQTAFLGAQAMARAQGVQLGPRFADIPSPSTTYTKHQAAQRLWPRRGADAGGAPSFPYRPVRGKDAATPHTDSRPTDPCWPSYGDPPPPLPPSPLHTSVVHSEGVPLRCHWLPITSIRGLHAMRGQPCAATEWLPLNRTLGCACDGGVGGLQHY